VFEYRVLRRICGAEREVITGDWRKQHNEEDEMAEHASCIGHKGNGYRILVVKYEGKRLITGKI